MSKTTNTKNSINPVIENLLKEPINFKLAKHPDKVSIKPSSYIVFKSYKDKSKNKHSLLDNKDYPADSSPKSPNTSNKMARPKSMAEAVANYAGKKYKDKNVTSPLASPNKKRKNNNDSNIIDKKQKIKKLLLLQQQQHNDHQNPDASPSTDESPDNVQEKSESNNDNDNDEDFHTAESEEGNSSDSDSASNGSDSASENNNENEPASPEEEEQDDEISDSDSIDPLKKDLKEDKLTKQILQYKQDSSQSLSPTDTPPTSNNDDEFNDINDENKGQLINNIFKNSDFYELSELPNDHGSNNSKRIDKSWGAFIENHTSLGLLNHGVTCYMNAAVQALCHIPSLTHYLIDVQKGKYDDSIKEDSVTKVLASTICKMYRIGHNRRTMYINPKKLCKRLDDINCMMSEWQQEDSHEYYMSLISRLQEDSTPKGVKLNQSIIYDIFGGLLDQTVTCTNCGHISTTQQEFYDLSLGLDSRKKRTSLMVDPKQLYQLRDQIENCKTSTKNDKSQLSKILQQRILLADDSASPNKEENNTNGSIKNNTTTNNNNNHRNDENRKDNDTLQKSQQQQDTSKESHKNTNENNKQDQQLPLQQSSKKYSIENSIKDFFTPEILKTDKQSGYICEKCGVKTNAIKISTIQRSPETLSIHLKRFRFEGQQSQKVKANVSYPEILDLTSFTTDMSTPTRYKLVSVIVHQGRSVSSGHYIAHCRQPDGTWATYDDEYINKIPRAVALTDPGAYVLVYERLTYKGTKDQTVEKDNDGSDDLNINKKSLNNNNNNIKGKLTYSKKRKNNNNVSSTKNKRRR